jgi:hypothetical protein
MLRTLVVLLMGMALSCSLSAQSAKSDSTVKGTAVPDTLASAKSMTDSVSKKAIDTLALRKDTTAVQVSIASDTTAARRDTAGQESPAKRIPPPEVIGLSPAPTTADPNGYKDAHWGMSLENVRKYLVSHEGVDDNDIQGVTNGFEYQGSLAGVGASFAYQFDNNRLFIVRLSPKIKAVSKFDYLDSFDSYRMILETKYGKPTRSGFSKVDESYLSTIESIQLGFAKKYVLWTFDRSYIVLALVGRDKQLSIHITYVSRAIFDEMTSRIETLKLEDF